jgi:hypothetical protein
MTPQQKIMSNLLQISLFKFAEEAHETIATFSSRYGKRPGVQQKLDELTSEVESMVDRTIQDYIDQGDDFTMDHVDLIHAKLMKLRELRDA